MSSFTELESLVGRVRAVHRRIRADVVEACERSTPEQLGAVAADARGDTIYAIDKVSEQQLVSELEGWAASVGGIVLVAEGVGDGELALPDGQQPNAARWRLIVDPIDGTRGLMYQKRSAWVLTGIAPNRGASTQLVDIVASVQTEIPLVKQHLCDELWAIRGHGAHAQRHDRLTERDMPLELAPSRAESLEHGYAMLSRFFPGARDEIASIDEALMLELLGPSPAGKALCFEDQYASSGGQFYELMVGHDRFNADLRPLLSPLLARRGLSAGLCCHPYDVCTALIAEEAGVVLTEPDGAPLNPPLNVDADVAWVGYANSSLQRGIEPVLQRELRRRGWLT